VSAQYPALLRTPDAAAERALLAAVAPSGVLLVVHHAGMDTRPPDDGGFDPADHVRPSMIRALLDEDWTVERDEQRPRIAPDGGAGAHHPSTRQRSPAGRSLGHQPAGRRAHHPPAQDRRSRASAQVVSP
jgi:hypothetical protein